MLAGSELVCVRDDVACAPQINNNRIPLTDNKLIEEVRACGAQGAVRLAAAGGARSSKEQQQQQGDKWPVGLPGGAATKRARAGMPGHRAHASLCGLAAASVGAAPGQVQHHLH